MKNIHTIPTDKPSRLFTNRCGELKDHSTLCTIPLDSIGSNQNIYITSNEEIKEGDWFMQTTYKGIFKASSIKIVYIHFNGDSYEPIAYCKKIVLTTDQDLIKDGVQAIDDEFLEWFVKNPDCENVEVKSWKIDKVWDKEHTQFNPIYPMKPKYKIIIPKEEFNNPNNQEVENIKKFGDIIDETIKRASGDVSKKMDTIILSDFKRLCELGVLTIETQQPDLSSSLTSFDEKERKLGFTLEQQVRVSFIGEKTISEFREQVEKYRQALKDCRQAMIDYGMNEKSIQIICIDNVLNEEIMISNT